MIRDLEGIISREKDPLGAVITLNPPTKDMLKEAASAGFYESPLGHKYPRIQILTIEDFLSGKKLEYPKGGLATFKKAEPKSKGEHVQEKLF